MMKRYTIPSLLLFVGLSGCENLQLKDNCEQLSEIVTSSECYDASKGLMLTALHARENRRIRWAISFRKDTLDNTLYETFRTTSDSRSVIIPDSILKDYRFIYVGTTRCNSPLAYTFELRSSPDSTCKTWHLTSKFVQGD